MTLAAQGVCIQRGGRKLLDEVSIRVAPGELVAVLGANGAGKSTLLRVLAGDIAPDAGEVTLNGKPLGAWTLEERARQRAVLPQHSGLAFPFTALEVVQLGRTAWHDPRRRVTAIAQAALAAAGASAFEQREYPTLSGGERQRVQLARVLAQLWDTANDGAGRYLLLDEPTSSLDLVHQQTVLALARKLTRQGFGALVILHDPNLAFGYADRSVVLAGGRCLAEGTAEALANAALFQQAFGMEITVINHPVSGRPWVLPLHDIR